MFYVYGLLVLDQVKIAAFGVRLYNLAIRMAAFLHSH
jgi:hypothetical protein